MIYHSDKNKNKHEAILQQFSGRFFESVFDSGPSVPLWFLQCHVTSRSIAYVTGLRAPWSSLDFIQTVLQVHRRLFSWSYLKLSEGFHTVAHPFFQWSLSGFVVGLQLCHWVTGNGSHISACAHSGDCITCSQSKLTRVLHLLFSTLVSCMFTCEDVYIQFREIHLPVKWQGHFDHPSHFTFCLLLCW